MAGNEHCQEREINLNCVKRTLTKSRKLLCDHLCPDKILLTLQSEEEVTPNDATRIKASITNTEKVEALLDKLAVSPVSSYQVFMRALKEERPDLHEQVKAIEEISDSVPPMYQMNYPPPSLNSDYMNNSTTSGYSTSNSFSLGVHHGSPFDDRYSSSLHHHWSSPAAAASSATDHGHYPLTSSQSGSYSHHRPIHDLSYGMMSTASAFNPRYSSLLMQPPMVPPVRPSSTPMPGRPPTIPVWSTNYASSSSTSQTPSYGIETDTNVFDLDSCQEELIDFYSWKMCQVTLLPWHDEVKHMDGIYVSLELENERKVLDNNEDLANITMPDGTLSKRIIVKGTVGSGKSTLMAKLAYTWAQRNRKSSLYQYDLVFILSFREIQKGCTVSDAIFQQILADDTRVSKIALETFIHSNSNILFLMDGFDEYFAETLDTVHGEIDAMLNFQTFRKACVIVSSRPHKHFGNCQSLYTPVNLTGFSNKSVKLYISKYFSKHSNKSELEKDLNRKLSESKKIKTLSRTPIILMLMCMLWEDSQSLSNTQSELYAEFTQLLWKKFCHRSNMESEYDRSKQFLISLGEVAFDGLMPKEDICQEKLVFCKSDFMEEDLENGCQVGLVTKERLRSRLSVSNAITFLHKSFQEYCASYYWANLPDNEFDCALQKIDTIGKVTKKFESLKFLSGTCDTDHAIRTIDHVIQVYLAKIKKSGDMICSNANNQINLVFMLLLESDFTNGSVDLARSLRSLLCADRNLVIAKPSYWLSFVKSPLASSLNQVKSVKFKDTAPDVIAETLIHLESVETVKIEFHRDISTDFSLSEDSMNKLGLGSGRLKNLSDFCIENHTEKKLNINPIIDPISDNREIQLKTFKCQALGQVMTFIASVFISDGNILCNLLSNQHQLHTLILNGIELRNGNVESILDAIKAPLCELTMDHMHIGSAISHIEHIIPHLQCLSLWSTGLKENDIFTLGEFLPNAKNLSELDLSWNYVGKAVCKLGCIIPQLEKLDLYKAELEEDDISTLSEFLKEAKCLSYMDLRRNNVGVGQTGIKLCESLKSCSKLKTSYLFDTGLTNRDVSALKSRGVKIGV